MDLKLSIKFTSGRDEYLLTLTGVPYIGETPKPIRITIVTPKHALTTRHHGTLPIIHGRRCIQTVGWESLPHGRQPLHQRAPILLPTLRTLDVLTFTALKTDSNIKLTHVVRYQEIFAFR